MRNIRVTTWRNTIEARTGAERYFKSREADAEYADTLANARATTDAIDSLVRSLDERRIELELSKVEVARRAHMKSEVVRRLFSAKASNPTISTLVGIAAALNIQLVAQPKPVRAEREHGECFAGRKDHVMPDWRSRRGPLDRTVRNNEDWSDFETMRRDQDR